MLVPPSNAGNLVFMAVAVLVFGCGNNGAGKKDSADHCHACESGPDGGAAITDGGHSDAGGEDAATDPYSQAFGVYAAFDPEFPDFMKNMGQDYFGYMAWATDRMRELGATWSRSNNQFIWDLIEPEVGRGYDWNANIGGDDLYSGLAQAAGTYNLVVLHEGGGPVAKPGRPQARNPLDNLEDYLKFVRAAAERYDGDGTDDAPSGYIIRFWQLGNEIGDWTGSGRTAADYFKWFEAAAEAIRGIIPDARFVLIASTDASRLDPFHQEVMTSLAENGVKFDAIDLHHWGTADLDGSRMDSVPAYRDLLAQLGLDGVELWSCEHGTFAGDPNNYLPEPCSPACQNDKVCAGVVGCVPRCTLGAPCPQDNPVCNPATDLCTPGVPPQTFTDQARSLVYRYVVNRALGVKRILWNNLVSWRCLAGICGGHFDLMGLLSNGYGPGENMADIGKPHPAFYTYRMLVERTEGTVAEQLGQMATGDASVHAYAYRNRKSGKTGFVVWSDTAKLMSLEFPGGGARLTSLITDSDGAPVRSESLAVADGKVNFTADPDPIWIGAEQ